MVPAYRSKPEVGIHGPRSIRRKVTVENYLRVGMIQMTCTKDIACPKRHGSGNRSKLEAGIHGPKGIRNHPYMAEGSYKIEMKFALI